MLVCCCICKILYTGKLLPPVYFSSYDLRANSSGLIELSIKDYVTKLVVGQIAQIQDWANQSQTSILAGTKLSEKPNYWMSRYFAHLKHRFGIFVYSVTQVKWSNYDQL